VASVVPPKADVLVEKTNKVNKVKNFKPTNQKKRTKAMKNDNRAKSVVKKEVKRNAAVEVEGNAEIEVSTKATGKFKAVLKNSIVASCLGVAFLMYGIAPLP
jgi:hypothetical protein